MTNPLVTAVPLTGDGIRADLRAGLASAIALVLKDADAVAAFTALDLGDDGTPYEAVYYAGTLYEYDPADATTAHDPAGGCIVSQDGRRYIRAQAVKPDWIVLDKDLTAPPGSPAQGDAYFVAASATGAWAGQDGDYALYGSRGWTFRPVEEGHILYVADEGCFYHMPGSGTLTKGLGDLALANASVEAKHLAFPMGLVVQAAQAAPPPSPGDRVAWLVTATASGAWTGKEDDIAEYDSAAAAWVFHSPYDGATIWDLGAGYLKVWNGSAWVRAVPDSGSLLLPPVQIVEEVYAGTTTVNNWKTIYQQSITAEAGESILLDVLSFTCAFKPSASGTIFWAIRLLKDDEATALVSASGSTSGTAGTYMTAPTLGDNQRLLDVAADGAAHLYKFQIRSTNVAVIDPRATVKARFTIAQAPVTS